jgi:drug/metabolite transporter (DMT)-like permease
MALRQVGGTIGVAILGAVLAFGYHSELNLEGVPASAAAAARESVAGGVAVAQQLDSPRLLDSARVAFVHGMDMTLWVCAGLMLLGIILALIFLPQRTHAKRVESHLMPSDHEVLASE